MAVPADISDSDMLLYIRDAIRAVTLRQEYKGPGGQYLKSATLAELMDAEQVFKDRVAIASRTNPMPISLARFGDAQ